MVEAKTVPVLCVYALVHVHDTGTRTHTRTRTPNARLVEQPELEAALGTWVLLALNPCLLPHGGSIHRTNRLVPLLHRSS